MNSSRGFTLIELVVVIAILGILAGVTVPLMTNYLNGAKERSFTADREQIQNAVDGYYNAPDNARFIGKRQYPVIGRGQTTQGSLSTATSSQSISDDGNPFDGGSGELWNPVGGTEGVDLTSNPKWTDGAPADGVRTTGTPTADWWTSVPVIRGGTTYHTDPRYFFVDFEALVSAGLLSEVPDSAAPDNRPQSGTGTYTGSYIWYVDNQGHVKALDRYLPSLNGYQDGVFP